MVDQINDSHKGSDLFQERLDELFLLETRVNERLDRLEAHYVKRSESLKLQEKYLQDLVGRQHDSLNALTKQSQEAYAWYRQVQKIGGILSGILILGLACIFLWWWHVSDIAKNNEEVDSAIHRELNHLPLITYKDHRAYIRIVPDASVPELKDDDGQPVKGVYAQVYFEDQSD